MTPLIQLGRTVKAAIPMGPLPTVKSFVRSASDALRVGQTDPQSLLFAIAGDLREQFQLDVNTCLNIAGQFYDGVWGPLFGGTPPGNKNLERVDAIFRAATR